MVKSLQHHRRANHLQHPPNPIITRTTAVNKWRTHGGFLINRARGVAWLRLRHVGERWIVLAVVAAHFVNQQGETE
jgi:hypothetical protein